MIKNIQNDINKYISLENETKIIIDKLSIIRDFKHFKHIIHINYNVHVLWNNNYEFYTKKQLIHTFLLHFTSTLYISSLYFHTFKYILYISSNIFYPYIKYLLSSIFLHIIKYLPLSIHPASAI